MTSSRSSRSSGPRARARAGPGRRRARTSTWPHQARAGRAAAAGARTPSPAGGGRRRTRRGPRGRAHGGRRAGGRRPRRRSRARRRAAHAPAAHLGAGAVVGEGPLRRQPNDQRARRVAAGEAGLPPRRPAPAAAWCPPTAGTSGRRAPRRRTPRASRASSRSGSTPASTGRSPSPGSTSSGATPARGRDDAWLTTFTIVTTDAEPGLDVIHDRMPFVVPEDRWADWLDPELTDPDAVRALLQPPVPGRFVATAVSTGSTPSSTTAPSCSSRLPLGELRGVVDPATGELIGAGEAPALLSGLRRRPPQARPRLACTAAHRRAGRRPRVGGVLVLGHGAGGGVGAPRPAWPRSPRRRAAGLARRAGRAAVARRGPQGRGRAATARRGVAGGDATARRTAGEAAARRRRSQRGGAGGLPDGGRGSGAAAVLAWRSRCTRRGAPSAAAPAELAGAGVPGRRRPGGARRVRHAGGPRGARPARRARSSRRRATTRCAAAAGRRRGRPSWTWPCTGAALATRLTPRPGSRWNGLPAERC